MAGHNVLEAANKTTPRENMVLPLADPAGSGDAVYRSATLEAVMNLASKAIIQSGNEAPAGSHLIPGRQTLYFRTTDPLRLYYHSGVAESNWVEFVRAQPSESGDGGGGATAFLGLTDTPDAFGARGTLAAVNDDEDGIVFVEPEASRALPAARIYQYSAAQDDVAHHSLTVGTKTTASVDWSATEIERDGGLGIQIASAVITFNGISNTDDVWAVLNAAPKLFVNDAVCDFALRWTVEDGTDPNNELADYTYLLREARVGKAAGETVFDMVAEETRVKLRGKVLEVGHIHRLSVDCTPHEVGTAPNWGFKDSQADDASGLWLRPVEEPVEPDAAVYKGPWDGDTVYPIGSETSHHGEIWRKNLAGGNEEPVPGNRRIEIGAVSQAEIGSVLFAQDTDPNIISFHHEVDGAIDVGDLDPEELEAAANTAGGNAGFISIIGYSPVGAAGSVSFRMNGVHPQNYRYAFYLGNDQYRTDQAQFYNHGDVTTWRFALPARATAQAARPAWWSTTQRQLLKAETKAADTSEEVWSRVTVTAEPELPDGGEEGQVLKSTGESRQGAWRASGELDALPELPTPDHVGQVAVSGGRWWVVKHDSSEAVNVIDYEIARSTDDPHLWGFEVGSFGRVTVNPHGLVNRVTIDDQTGAMIVEVLRSAVLDNAGDELASFYVSILLGNNSGRNLGAFARVANLDVAAHAGYIMYSTNPTQNLGNYYGDDDAGDTVKLALFSDSGYSNKIGLNLASLVWSAMTSADIELPVYESVDAAPEAGDQRVGTTALIDGAVRTVVPADSVPQKGLHEVTLKFAGSLFARENSTLGRAHVSRGEAVDNWDDFVGWTDWEQGAGAGGTYKIGLRADIPGVALPSNLVLRTKLYGDSNDRTLTVVKQSSGGETIDGARYDLFSVATADYNTDHDYVGTEQKTIDFYTAYTSDSNNAVFEFKKRAPATIPSHWSQAGVKWESIRGDTSDAGVDYLFSTARGNYMKLTKDVREARAVAVVIERTGLSFRTNRHFFTIEETPTIATGEVHSGRTSEALYGQVVSPGGTSISIGFGFALFANGLSGEQPMPMLCLSAMAGSDHAVVDVLAIF